MQNRQNGQSLVEVIIASTVGILVVVALTFATIFSLRNASFSKNSAQATKLAQEGIERVRKGRDRNRSISISGKPVVSWDGTTGICTSHPEVKADSIWCYQIKAVTECENPTLTGSKCYFSISPNGNLTPIGFAFTPNQSNPIPSLAEGTPSPSPVFRRAVILSDDAKYYTQKTVTVIVTWTDVTGFHESRLVTILRKQ